ncbi:MAG: hypothetical protein DWQ31_00065 [Planctomycetota bacterium]|nr:MAG: hypothetical protein DWQ31_00065 [Planctomycetota bacterium]REJ93186.1 MAG: hypothetical protein DWQ35_10940 [Planctomycetota bacterium]REK23371.1 MAG: hypothetical protein DWQ42_15525 [Planctomycetota bacterium]REK47174.1 MAG: hypothetical protein DWQ46_04905 [Planctomycetota bacterium]
MGFLTVEDCTQRGLFGGYLLLNAAGRPLEFHCTAPVKPNRAQQILYGTTLAPFLYGEQIGHTLLREASLAPSVVLTDCVEMHALAPLVDCPVVLVEQALPARASAVEEANLGATWDWFAAGSHRVAMASGGAAERDLVIRQMLSLPAQFDPAEPFERIRLAIAEAAGPQTKAA